MVKLNNLIKYVILGIFLPASLQSMDEATSIKSLKEDMLKLRQSLGVKDEPPPLISFRTLNLLSEHKLSVFSDPSQYEKGSTLYNEETANQTYAQSLSAQQAFSTQPDRNSLKNHVGTEVEQSLTRKEQEKTALKTTWSKFDSWQKTTPSYMYPQDRIERHVKAEEFAYLCLFLQFAHNHGAKAVMLGEREPTEDEKKALDLRINPKTPAQIITQAAGIRSSAIGTPYMSKDAECHQGFVITDELDLKMQTRELRRQLEALRTEYSDMSDVWLEYSKDFLLQVEGWSNLPNWVGIKSTAEDFRKKIKVQIEKKYPQGISPSDKDLILAEIKRQRFLKKAFLPNIRKLPPLSDLTYVIPENQQTFQKVYEGKDDLSTHDITYKVGPTIRFKTVKERRTNVMDIDRFKIQVMWKNPSDHSLKNLGPNKVGLFLRGEDSSGTTLYCKLKDIESEFGIATFEASLADRLKIAVEANVLPSPQDERALLELLKQSAFITESYVPDMGPKGARMVTAFPDTAYAVRHRIAWNDANIFTQLKWYREGVEDASQRRPKLKPAFPCDINYEETYRALFKEYEQLLFDYFKLLVDMYTPYKEGKTRIPRGWKFFIAETYETQPAKRIVPEEISLHNAELVDSDLNARGKNKVLDLLLGCANVNLSYNQFEGKASYSFAHLTRLNLSHNKLTSLAFLPNLVKLVVLDLSHNLLFDLSGFFAQDEDQYSTLQELDLSHNQATEEAPLGSLKGLKRLNISHNNFNSLNYLSPEYRAEKASQDQQTPVRKSALVSLKANNNQLKGHWKDVLPPQGLDCLTELELRENPGLMWNPQGLNEPALQPSHLRAYFPALMKLHTDKHQVEDLDMELAVIDLSNQNLIDSSIYIDSKDSALQVTRQGKMLCYPLLANAVVNLSSNSLTGTSLPVSSFCSWRIVKLLLPHNKLTGIDFVAGLTELTYLDISDNMIPDISSLQSCSKLLSAFMSQNLLTSLLPLKECQGLLEIIVNNNTLPKLDSSVFPTIKSVTRLEVQGNSKIERHGFSAFKTYFPSLKTLKKLEGYVGTELPKDQNPSGSEESQIT